MHYKTCPLCGHENLHTVLHYERIPVFDNVLTESLSAARSFPQGTEHLVQCLHCGFVFNCEFEPEKVTYGAGYHAERGHSPYYLRHISHIIDFIETVKPIKDRYILEVACGNGEFLRQAAKRRPEKAVGVDPSTVETTDGVLVMQQALFDQEYLQGMDHPIDILINRHMIEHILNPLEMLRQFHEALAEGGTLYLETPRLDWILDNNIFFDFPYEHCSYYSDRVIERMLKASGFEIIAREDSYDGQYFSICAKKCGTRFPMESAGAEELRQEQLRFSALNSAYAAMNQGHIVQSFKTSLASDLSAVKEEVQIQQGICLWGAAAKGVMCVNLLDQWPIAGLIDKNVCKQGKFIPGTGHQVFAPSDITYEKVKIIIVENDVYMDEIQCDLQRTDPRIAVYSLSAIIDQYTASDTCGSLGDASLKIV